MTLIHENPCKYCGHTHGDLCPKVKAYRFDKETGALIGVEFFAPNDYIHPEIVEAARQIAERAK
jgi:hypothetical protein